MNVKQEVKKSATENTKRPNQGRPRKGPEAKVAVASVEAAERPPRKSKFAGALGWQEKRNMRLFLAQWTVRLRTLRKELVKSNEIADICGLSAETCDVNTSGCGIAQ